MKRHSSKHLRPARPLAAGHAVAEHKSDGDWVVRTVPGARALKEYVCPGCLGTIAPATPHIVAWPHDPGWGRGSGVEQRRHWHTGCWRRKR